MKIDIAQLEFMAPDLRMMLLEVENAFGEQTITSLFRIGDPGVHGTLPLRGTDFRCHDKDFGEKVAAWVNERWEYDYTRPNKPCCKFHKVNGGGWHLHFQSHPNTKRRALPDV